MKVKKISCEEFKEKIDDFLIGDMDLVQTMRFKEHSRNCSTCHEVERKHLLQKIDKEGYFWTRRPVTVPCLSSETLTEYLDGKLTKTEENAVEIHLKICSFCDLRIRESRDKKLIKRTKRIY